MKGTFRVNLTDLISNSLVEPQNWHSSFIQNLNQPSTTTIQRIESAFASQQ